MSTTIDAFPSTDTTRVDPLDITFGPLVGESLLVPVTTAIVPTYSTQTTSSDILIPLTDATISEN